MKLLCPWDENLAWGPEGWGPWEAAHDYAKEEPHEEAQARAALLELYGKARQAQAQALSLRGVRGATTSATRLLCPWSVCTGGKGQKGGRYQTPAPAPAQHRSVGFAPAATRGGSPRSITQ